MQHIGNEKSPLPPFFKGGGICSNKEYPPLKKGGRGDFLAAPINRAIIVCGPTASGKSALALALAQQLGGIIINADSQQLYDGFRILTARPSPEDEELAPHRLYGIIDPVKGCSVGEWRKMAMNEISLIWGEGKLPILVGGSGLYLKAMIEGLSPVPEIPDDIRKASRSLLAEIGNQAFHKLLQENDPLTSARLAPGNSQRLARAWEVLQATGKSLAEWQNEPAIGTFPGKILTITIMPPRDDLYHACNNRFQQMIEKGAIAEVEAFLQNRNIGDCSDIKILGFPQIVDFLSGKTTLDKSVTAAQTATRNYAKRQVTWFRHQIVADKVISAQYSERFFDEIVSFLHSWVGSKIPPPPLC